MLVPLNWLKDYVAIPENPTALIERLTLAGLESSSVRVLGFTVPEGMRIKEEGLPWPKDQILVAKVTSIVKHPNADKLKLVTLEYGASEPKTVVTGAPNIAPGQSGMKVILGLRGSKYYFADKDGNKTVQMLSPKELRGIMNDAMCMSDYELGISEDHDGIIILDDSDAAPGTPAADVLGDVIVDLEVLPNMARCLAMLGVAREVAALTGASVNDPKIEYDVSGEAIAGQVHVKVEDPTLCPRYTATLIRGVTIGPAPRKLRTRLKYAGVRSINNVVDITNYVMLEYGQPQHAFDFDALVARAGGKAPTIEVRRARAGEKLKTLDGQERALSAENLVIADGVGPIALAGVMGGGETEVTEKTKNILLESATFDPVIVRKSARQFALFSESSSRFTRGVPCETAATAARRAAQLLYLHTGGKVAPGTVDVYPTTTVPQVIELNRTEIARLLGFALPDGEVERILTALRFKVEPSMWGWTVTAPSDRLDIQAGAADVIEDLARIAGYHRLPETRLALELPAQTGNRELAREEKVRDILVDAGLSEVINYALVGPEIEGKLDPNFTGKIELADAKYVALANPMSPDKSVLRTVLLPGVLEAASRNLRNGVESLALFEVGPCWLSKPGDAIPNEFPRLAIAMCGRRSASSWGDPQDVKPAAIDFFDLKGVLETLFTNLGIAAEFRAVREIGTWHPGRQCEVVIGGTVVGRFGELHPKVSSAFEFGDKAVQAAEFDLTPILDAIPERYAYKPISVFPSFLHDIAVVVSEEVDAATCAAEIKTAGGEVLESARLFDLYRGDSIPAGTKSLAYALTYRLPDRQLTEKEVQKAHENIETRLRKQLQAKIRGKDGV